MIVERIGSRRVLGSSLTALAIVLSSSVALAQQPSPQPAPPPQQQDQPQQAPGQQSAQPPSQQAPGQQPAPAPSQQQGQPSASDQQAGRPAPEQEDVEIARAAPPAEETQPTLNAVRVIQVKHDRVAEFEGLIKELGMAMQEFGQPGFMVWSVVVGDVNTYHIVAEFDSFASIERLEQPPMEPVEWANWVNRIGDTIDSHTMIIGRMRPELSIVPTEQGQQPPELLMLIKDTVAAGKTREYEAFVRDELIPALKQAHIDAAFATELMFGAEGRTWVYAVPLPGWQVLDGPSPLVEALGPQAAEELMLRGDALVDESETALLRYRADLSAQPAQ